MSHMVVRGEPLKCQLYLDTVLDAILKHGKINSNVKGRDDINLAEIIYHCLKMNPNGIYMINGSTGVRVTNEDILRLSVSLARAFLSRDLKGKRVLLINGNHEQMAALYYGMFFSGVVPLLIDPYSTVYEIQYFIKLASPEIIFCDQKRFEEVLSVAYDTTVVVVDDEAKLKKFIEGQDGDLENFMVSDVSPDSTLLMLPTSGSSGFPKASILTHEGMIFQLPVIWTINDTFPRPTELAMLLSTAQWLTHTILLTTCPVYGVALLMTPEKPTPEHVLAMVEKFQPSWALFGPAFTKSLAVLASPKQLKSLETIVITGSPLSQNTRALLEEKLSKHTQISNAVGQTEIHGFFTVPDRNSPPESNGKIYNGLFYKIVDEDENDLGLRHEGELWLKNDRCIFKGYLNNDEAYRETVTSTGWLKTGDIFYIDENEEIYFVERKKFLFKYMNYQISPVELEQIISSIPGVQDCVVCRTERGPAAAVVLKEGIENVTEELINNTVNTKLSDYKRLRGGIVFVASLPYTHSGKVKRAECERMINQLLMSA